MGNKISVIIPVFNVETYIRRCVDSVLGQTYKDIEVILVDDGSPDNCPKICDEYAAIDSRVIVLHKDNGGLSSARNAGLNLPCTGEFVTFIDSDDWIEPDTYEYCMNLVNKYDVKCVQYEINLTDSCQKKVRNPKEIINIYSGSDVLQYFMLRATQRSGGYSVCGGIYHISLLDNLKFREGKVNEDIDFKFMVMQRCNKMAVSNQKKYNYFQEGNTLSSGGLKQRDFQLREAADILCELSSKVSYGNIAFLGKVKQARTAFSLLCKIAYYGIADNRINKQITVRKLVQEHRHNLWILLRAPIPFSRKILATLFAINYAVTEKIIHFARKS